MSTIVSVRRRLPHIQRNRVTICIPAWQAEPFIERTLDLALGQTHKRVRVIVSVDKSDDETAKLCHRRARRDHRLNVYAHAERLGWAANVNFVLDQVRTPYFFLYFHDDLIVPQYTELMLKALREHPDAVSAHCDLGHFGARDTVDPGCDYLGTAEERLASWFVAPRRGSPLRSLARRALLDGGLRMPTDTVTGLWANWPFLLQMLAAGKAVHVNQRLYFRWERRRGGLTDGWTRLAPEELRADLMRTTASILKLVDSVATSPDMRLRLTYCAYLHQLRLVRLGGDFAISGIDHAGDLHPAFAALTGAPDLSPLGPEITGWARALADALPPADRL